MISDKAKIGIWYAVCTSLVYLCCVVYWSALAGGKFESLPSAVAIVLLWFVTILAFGLLLYVMRRAQRLFYGIVEVSVSGFLIYSAFKQVLLEKFSVSVMLSVGLALYVFVRGMDNVGEGAKRYPRFSAWWSATFPTLDKGAKQSGTFVREADGSR
jgi:hypothetical protein